MNIEINHEDKIKELDEKIKDACENQGEIEIRDAYINKADYYFQIKDFIKAREVYKEALEKTVGTQKKLDINIQIL